MTNSTSPPVTTNVRLLGTQLVLRTDGDPARLERLAAELDARLSRVVADANLAGQPTRAALLVALGLLDDYEELKRRHAALERTIASSTAAMLGRLDRTLALEEAPV